MELDGTMPAELTGRDSAEATAAMRVQAVQLQESADEVGGDSRAAAFLEADLGLSQPRAASSTSCVDDTLSTDQLGAADSTAFVDDIISSAQPPLEAADTLAFVDDVVSTEQPPLQVADRTEAVDSSVDDILHRAAGDPEFSYKLKLALLDAGIMPPPPAEDAQSACRPAPRDAARSMATFDQYRAVMRQRTTHNARDPQNVRVQAQRPAQRTKEPTHHTSQHTAQHAAHSRREQDRACSDGASPAAMSLSLDARADAKALAAKAPDRASLDRATHYAEYHFMSTRCGWTSARPKSRWRCGSHPAGRLH